MAAELQVINDFYDLTHYLVGRIARFPRHHRHGLGTDMERRLQVILALLVRAKYLGQAEGKTRLLADANIEVEVLRFQLRLARDLAALPTASHGHALQRLGQVGSQIGGWLRSSTRPQAGKS
jgi:hypothetical protein